MKLKFNVIFLCALVIISFSCRSDFSLFKNNVDSGSIYSNNSLHGGIIDEYYFNHFKDSGRKGILESKDLSEKNKKLLVSSIDNLRYIKNKYLYFYMLCKKPYFDNELSLKFKVIDKNGKDYFQDFTLISIKHGFIYQGGNTVNRYEYAYIITLSNLLDEIMKDSKIQLIVSFPDKSELIYQI